jgi:hypothetical protein
MRKTKISAGTPVSRLGRHILLTGSRAAEGPGDPGSGNRAYSGYIDLSDRLQQNAFLTGISPELAPGLVLGDYLVRCSDYTGTANDPYTGVGDFPLPVLGNMPVSPLFFQTFAALKSDVLTITATATDHATIVLHTPEGVSGIDGGHAFLDISPQSPASWGTYVFRIIRITNVPANPAMAYSGDVYELGVTIDDAQLLEWGEED